MGRGDKEKNKSPVRLVIKIFVKNEGVPKKNKKFEIYKFTCGCKFRVKFKSIDFIGFEAIFF